MLISTKQGRRGQNDRIVIIQTDGVETLSLKALLHMIQLFMENEDRIYPPKAGYKGRWLVYDAISDVANGSHFSDVAREYLMPKHVRSAKKLIEERSERIYKSMTCMKKDRGGDCGH